MMAEAWAGGWGDPTDGGREEEEVVKMLKVASSELTFTFPSWLLQEAWETAKQSGGVTWIALRHSRPHPNPPLTFKC